MLQANPKALLLPRIGMDPPAWWRQAHPDDVMQWEDGRRESCVVASPQYRRDAAERLAALVTHLEEKFGDHVAGYHPCRPEHRRMVLSGHLEAAAQRLCPGRPRGMAGAG